MVLNNKRVLASSIGTITEKAYAYIVGYEPVEPNALDSTRVLVEQRSEGFDGIIISRHTRYKDSTCSHSVGMIRVKQVLMSKGNIFAGLSVGQIYDQSFQR